LIVLHEYSNLEYVRIYVIYRATQAEYIIRILVAASQGYVNTFSTRRVPNARPPPPPPPPPPSCIAATSLLVLET